MCALEVCGRVDNATIAYRCTRSRRGKEVFVCEPAMRDVVLGRMVESDEYSHKTRGGDGTTSALYGLRVW